MNKKLIEEKIRFLDNQVRKQSELLRKLLSDTNLLDESTNTTKSNFNFQWENVPYSENVKKTISDILEYTQFPPSWFNGKNIADMGCGSGRFSYGFCSLNCNEVLSIDTSIVGLKNTKELCKSYNNHIVWNEDLLNLKLFDYSEYFDLVWCYGVIHHTSNPYKAFKNIAQSVKKGGYIFLMIYGEPRSEKIEDYIELNKYESLRKVTKNLSANKKLSLIRQMYPISKTHGYFDAISPVINELFSWEEIEGWLLDEGFVDIKRTVDSRNHHVIAQKVFE